jgi:hypothetical protein
MITTIPRSRTLLTAALVFGAFLLALIGATSARADAVDDWYTQTNNAVTASLAAGVSAQASNSRIWAYSWTAANNAVERGGSRGHGRSLTGDAAQAAVAQSVHDVLVALTPQIQPALDAQLTASLAAIPDGSAKSRGIRRGSRAAARLLASRAGDGLDFASVNLPYTPGPAVTWEWQFVPPLTRGPVQVGLPNARPFILDRANRFRPPPPPGPGTAIYRRDFNEAKEFGGATSAVRTQAQTDLAWWISQSSLNQYTQVLRAVLNAKSSSPVAWKTKLIATFHQVTTDAQIAVFETKYHYTTWRPYSAVRNGDTDGDPETIGDPNYTTLISAPQHPEYPSGHLTYSGAAQVVLTAFVGPNAPQPFTAVSPVPQANGLVLSYGNNAWEKLVVDNNNGRVGGGIHFRNSDEVGTEIGRKVAAYDLKHLDDRGHGHRHDRRHGRH